MGGLTADNLAKLGRSGNNSDIENQDRPDNLKGTEVTVNSSLKDSFKSEKVLEGGEKDDEPKEKKNKEEKVYEREHFHTLRLHETPIEAEDYDTTMLTLEDDYFSYALFAFYIFQEEDELIVKGDTRVTEKYNKMQRALDKEKAGMGTKAEQIGQELDIQYIRYARRQRNLGIWFRALFLFLTEVAMIIFVV